MFKELFTADESCCLMGSMVLSSGGGGDGDGDGAEYRPPEAGLGPASGGRDTTSIRGFSLVVSFDVGLLWAHVTCLLAFPHTVVSDR